jgi:predicted nucleotide-binding protein
MSSIKDHTGESSDPALPKLRVSREEACEKITAQRMKGNQILLSLTSAPKVLPAFKATFEKAKSDQEKWTAFTIDLLKTLFVGMQIGKEFGQDRIPYTGYQYEIENFVKWMNTRIDRLDSILERLDLFPLYGLPNEAAQSQGKNPNNKEIFLVHGQDEGTMHEVARFIEKIGLTPIILHEEPDKGRTIIEKFEDHSRNIGFAVVLMTPDDVGGPKGNLLGQEPRARQNVIFELGFFVGKLGRNQVCALRKGEIELPTDYLGVLYKPIDNAGAWKGKLARELLEAGISVDSSKAF